MARRRRQHHIALRQEMLARGLVAEDLGAMIGVEAAVINRKLSCTTAWRLDEAYDILYALDIDTAEFPKYFPAEDAALTRPEKRKVSMPLQLVK